jgi:hypothetical protein
MKDNGKKTVNSNKKECELRKTCNKKLQYNQIVTKNRQIYGLLINLLLVF